MANAVFTTQSAPGYDDLPEVRYHFPNRYLSQAEKTIGDWIVYYEPRRESLGSSSSSGRQCYFAVARVDKIQPDPKRKGHHYALVSNYLEFTKPVPFREGTFYPESSLRKPDGTTNKGKFGWALRLLPPEEFRLIQQTGFSETLPTIGESPTPTDDPPEQSGPRRTQILERPFRDAAFTRVVQTAYQGTCAVTGLRLVNGGGRCEIEAAHIQPVSDNGPDSPRNGIALSRTFHWLFDRGLFSISEKGHILTARKGMPDQLKRLLHPDGLAKFPSNPSWKPHPAFLQFHREKKFKGD